MTDSQQSVVAQWNEVLLDAVRSGSAKPTETTYQLHLTHAAIYDAWAAYDGDAYGHYSEISRPGREHTDANKTEAVSYAAYRMLVEFFPGQQDKFDTFMADLGFDPAVVTIDPSSPTGVGNLAAQGAFEAREGDGSNRENDYADTTGYAPVNSADPNAPNAPGGDDFDPNSWQPLRVPNGTAVDENGNPIAIDDDPSTYDDQEALTPQWGGVTPFALTSGDEVRPDAPPRLGDFSPYVDATGKVTTNDAAYREQFGEVLEISANLTPEQKAIAEFWADGPRTESPPGHWNQIAQDISKREGYGIDDDAKLFFALNAAVFDAGIATWEAKYTYDYVRPQSAIRDLFFDQEIEAWAGPNLGTQTILGQKWQPYQNTTFVTPPFPEFTSGHSGFSMAAAMTIASYVGSDAFYDGSSQGNYDLDGIPGIDLLGQFVATDLSFEDYDGPAIVLQWETLTEAAEEAGISRLYGGIHIQDGDLRGREIGEDVAQIAEQRWEALFTRGGDDVIEATRDGGLIIAGAGDDVVTGGRGEDIVEGGSGNDVIEGARGDDTLLGEEGRDVLFGGRGDDGLFGGEGRDVLDGGRGRDDLTGGAGRDTLIGGRGNDKLFGGDGRDDLDGGRGRDVLSGGNGRDTLEGGRGGDSFVFIQGETGFDIIEDFGLGNDEIVLVGFGDSAELRLRDDDDDTTLLVNGDKVAVLEGVDDFDLNRDVVFQDDFFHGV